MVEHTLDPTHKQEKPDPAEGETVIAEGVTFEDYLKHFDGQRTEWLAGKVILMSNNTRHQVILGVLFNIFSLFFGYSSLGRVLLAGIPMKVGDDKPAREPDLLIVLNDNLERIEETYLDGAADIAVEVVSPESSSRDRGVKFDEYEEAGVQEYWLIDPLRQEASVYVLGEDQRYRRTLTDEGGRLVSSLLPGFVLHPNLIWREEPPQGPEIIELVQAMVESV